jgi:hypothetical protein
MVGSEYTVQRSYSPRGGQEAERGTHRDGPGQDTFQRLVTSNPPSPTRDHLPIVYSSFESINGLVH